MKHSDIRLTQKFYVDLRIVDTTKAVESVQEIGAAVSKKGNTILDAPSLRES